MASEISLRGGLYAMADYDSSIARGLDPVRVVESMCEAGVPLLQLRAKSLPDRDHLAWVQASVQTCPPNTVLIINDRADLALIAGAQGVHLGQEDLPRPSVRRMRPSFVLGLSTHDLEQLRCALAEPIDYVAFGPVFPTTSKANAEPIVGVDALQRAHELTRQAGLPLVAIGGINDERLPQVAPYCQYVALISALLPEPGTPRPYDWIQRRCTELNAQIQRRQSSAVL